MAFRETAVFSPCAALPLDTCSAQQWASKTLPPSGQVSRATGCVFFVPPRGEEGRDDTAKSVAIHHGALSIRPRPYRKTATTVGRHSGPIDRQTATAVGRKLSGPEDLSTTQGATGRALR